MPGLLSNVFGDETEGEGTSQSAQSYDASSDAGIDLSPSVSLEHEASGSYQNLDGSTSEWTSDSNVTLTVDVGATLGAAESYEQSAGTLG